MTSLTSGVSRRCLMSAALASSRSLRAASISTSVGRKQREELHSPASSSPSTSLRPPSCQMDNLMGEKTRNLCTRCYHIVLALTRCIACNRALRISLDIGSRSIFDEDSDRFRESVRKFMREELAPMQSKFEEEGRPTKEIWRRLGEQVWSEMNSAQ